MYWEITPKFYFFFLFKSKISSLERELSYDGKHNYSSGTGEGSSKVRENKKKSNRKSKQK